MTLTYILAHASILRSKLRGIQPQRDLRKLLIHGARSVITRKKNLPQYLKELILRRGHQKAYVAVANRNARIIWAMMSRGTEYQSDYKKIA